RFGMELVELTEVFADTGFKAFQAPCVKGILVPGGADRTRSQLAALTATAQRSAAKSPVWMKVAEGGALTSPDGALLCDSERARSRRRARRPAAPRGRRSLGGASRPRAAARRARPPAGQRGRPPLPLGRRLPVVRGPRRGRVADPRAPPVHDAPRRGRPPARG